MKQFKLIPQTVLKIIEQHHEMILVRVFLQRKRAAKFISLQKLFLCQSVYVELITSERSSQDPLKPNNAIHYISNILGQPYDKNFFEVLKKIALASTQ